MKSVFDFECDCKAKTLFECRKPGSFEKNSNDVKCRRCGSLWRIVLEGMPGGELRFSLAILQPTRKLCEIKDAALREAERNRPQKKGLFFPVSRH